MTDILENLRAHYGKIGLVERLKTALRALGPDDQVLTPQEIAGLDQFHTRGLAATAELAALTEIDQTMSVLDVGSGIGGPARFLAATLGCHVTGIDLTEEFVEGARYLATRTGLADRVSFETGSALDMPFSAGSFDIALLQHVAMNIGDRDTLYRQIRRALKTGGRFATYDVVLKSGDPHYPVPWARTPEVSFLLSAEATQQKIAAAGFRLVTAQDDSEAAKAWVAQLRVSGPPAGPNLAVVMGPDFRDLATNLGRNLMEGRLGILTAVFEAV